MERFPTHGASAAGAQDEPISHPPSRPLPEPGLACPGFVRASSGRGFPAPLRSGALVAGKLWGSLPMRLRALPRQGPHHQPTKRLRGEPSMTSALRRFSGASAGQARIASVENLIAAPACLRLNSLSRILPGPMECGLTNPARAGRQQRQFALHPPWSPWLFFLFRMRSAKCRWIARGATLIPHSE